MRAADRRRALEQLEPVGLEDAQQRSEADVEQALDRCSVGGQALDRASSVRARPVADAQLVLLGAFTAAHDDACRRRVEADELTLVSRPWRAAGAAEVDSLEQVRLARAVRPVDDRQAGAEAGLSSRIRAEVAHLHAEHAHVR